jgi:hypothetical protein
MSTFSTIDQLAAMTTVPSPFAAFTSTALNNQSYPVGTLSTSFDGDSGVISGISTSPTPFEEIIVFNTVPPSVTAPAAVTTTECAYNNLQWEDCDFNNDNVPIGIFGKTWKQISVLKLHRVCTKLQAYGIKNAKKELIVESIVNTYKNRLSYNILENAIEEEATFLHPLQ